MSKLFPTVGTNQFPAKENEVLNMIEAVINQKINSAEIVNNLVDTDALYFYDCKDKTGRTIEESMVQAAEARGFKFINEGEQHDTSPKDPTIYTKYFKRWDEKQFKVTIRRDEIRAIIQNKGAGIDELVAKIIGSLTQGDNKLDFIERRKTILYAPVVDWATIGNGGKVPKTMDGVLTALRDMFDHIRKPNNDCTDPAFDSSCPGEEIRIAISERLLTLIDVNKLANTFNLSKNELMGKIVPIPVDDLPKSLWYKVVAYDHKALCVAEYIKDYTFEEYKNDRYTNHCLTVERMYFYNSLFKACALDCSVAAEAEAAKIFEAVKTNAITPTLNSKATLSNDAETVNKNMTYGTAVIPVGAGNISSLSVVVNMGGDITQDVYFADVDANKGYILIPAVTAPVTITVTDAA